MIRAGDACLKISCMCANCQSVYAFIRQHTWMFWLEPLAVVSHQGRQSLLRHSAVSFTLLVTSCLPCFFLHADVFTFVSIFCWCFTICVTCGIRHNEVDWNVSKLQNAYFVLQSSYHWIKASAAENAGLSRCKFYWHFTIGVTCGIRHTEVHWNVSELQNACFVFAAFVLLCVVIVCQ